MATGKWLRDGLCLLALTLGAALLFSPSFHYQFVTLDDGAHLYRNARLTPPTWESFWAFWLKPFQGLYVPVTYSVWAAITRLGIFLGQMPPLDPRFFHTANVVFHALNVGLSFLILRRLGFTSLLAVLGAAFFAVHPLQVESVAWISALKDLLCAFFSLLAIYALIPHKGRSRYGLGIVFFLLAIFSKPSASILPLFLIGLFGVLKIYPWREAAFRFLPWTLISVVLVFITKTEQPNEKLIFTTPWMQRGWVALDTLAFQLQKLLIPVGLTLNYGRTPARILQFGWYWLSIPAIGIAAILAYRWREKKSVQLMSLFVIALLPTIGLIPFYYQKYSTAADRFAYFAVFGVSLALASWLREGGGLRKAAVSIVIIGCARLSSQQLPIWNTDATLVTRITAIDPSAENHYALATMLIAELEGRNPVPGTFGRPLYQVKSSSELAEWEKLIEYHFKRAIEKDPEYALAYNNLGVFYQNRGKVTEAREAFQAAIAHAPRNPAAYNNLGVIEASLENYQKAKALFESALRLEPGYLDAQKNLKVAAQGGKFP